VIAIEWRQPDGRSSREAAVEHFDPQRDSQARGEVLSESGVVAARARAPWLPRWSSVASIFALGLPIGLHMLAEVGIFSVAGFLAARMGEVEMAAHQVALQLAAVMFMVPLGVASATSVRVGRAIGAGDDASVRLAGFAGIAIGAAFMMMSAVSMWTLSSVYARLMTTDASVLPLASRLIMIAGAFQLSAPERCAGPA
jgi:MATE family multidrug resistance protein